jgi:hypothetical protein
MSTKTNEGTKLLNKEELISKIEYYQEKIEQIKFINSDEDFKSESDEELLKEWEQKVFEYKNLLKE